MRKTIRTIWWRHVVNDDNDSNKLIAINIVTNLVHTRCNSHDDYDNTNDVDVDVDDGDDDDDDEDDDEDEDDDGDDGDDDDDEWQNSSKHHIILHYVVL